MDLKQQPKGSMEYYHIVSNLSESLSFSKDVMYEMGANGVPYSKADFSHLYRTSGLLARVSRSKNIKKAETKVSPCHTRHKAQENVRDLIAPFPVNLPPLHTTYSRSSAAKECVTVPGHQGKVLDSCKITGLGGHSNAYSCLKLVTASDQDGQSRNDKWQDCVLKKLTKTTAQWIVSQQVPRQSQYKAGLQSLLKGQYGSASATDLVTDEHMFEEDFCGLYEVPKCSPDPRVLQSSKVETPLPVYYRVQGYLVSPACTDEKGGFSQTANDVTVTHMETPRPPCLQESLKPRMGKYVFHTENNFEQELYSGKLNVVQTVNSRYHKYIQDLFPCGPEKWTGSLAVEMDRMGKGAQQWVDLPTKADYATELGPRLPDYSGQDTEVPKQQAHYRPMLKHSLLRYAVEKWRDAWKIKTKWQSMTVEGLKKALTHLHYHVRLVAIATCASAAVNRPQEELDLTKAAQRSQDWEVEAVPPELQPLLLAALHDPERTIQMAAALCQYAIGRPSAHARDILRDILWQDYSRIGANSWAAAQCLAIEGEASQAVIERLLSQHFASSTMLDKQQAANLLVSISRKTTLVRSLLAEELNSANSSTRVLACNIISQLKCPVNKDITSKLIYLMWNDWSGAVRQAAIQALGKLAMGSVIHDELRVRLDKGPFSWRVEALVLMGQLKIMTAKLLPTFLRCLKDDFVVVRKQACLTAASLQIKDETILNQLIELTQNDPSCEVKEVAINTLRRIGCLTPSLQENLLWVLHHEEEPRVRIAVCQALKSLDVKGPELQNVLQECYVLETNPQVHRHIEELMKSNGYSLEGDKSMVHRITDQIQKLCGKSIITECILLLEELELQQQYHKSSLGQEGQPTTSAMATLQQERCKGLETQASLLFPYTHLITLH
ncbi:HEAT repeat-containing protein 4 [Electrophorus electricus]|uniref:HEAT repeat-containing protein 4 n=1 Tax=Electrophorus electricus TaxID=8005 RepID=UPI0015D03980|nr:HEAT repeat-containing protein 4 [Electrophorus electricus]